MKKIKPLTFIFLVLLLALLTYLAMNYKEVKQTFINGFNDGKAEKARQEKMK